jgi:hypothetical protein
VIKKFPSVSYQFDSATSMGSPYKLDERNPSPYTELGHDKIVALSTAFYNRVVPFVSYFSV